MSPASEQQQVQLSDGAQVDLKVGTRSTTVTNTTAPSRVEFTARNPSSTASSAVGSGVTFTSHAVPPGGGGRDNGTGGYGTVVGGSIRYRQRTPAATWSFRHPLGRRPQVTVYIDPDGDAVGGSDELEQVDTAVEATDTTVIVTWPYPMSGELIVQ